MIAAAVLSTSCFCFAWRGVQALASQHRAAFGIRHRDGTAAPDDPGAWCADLD